MIHRLGIQSKYYGYIKNGTKRIELRLYDEKRQKIKIGDIIEFHQDGGQEFQAKVLGLLRYGAFEHLLNDFDTSVLADATMTKQELLDVLGKFYTPEKQKEYGVIGFRIEPIK